MSENVTEKEWNALIKRIEKLEDKTKKINAKNENLQKRIRINEEVAKNETNN